MGSYLSWFIPLCIVISVFFSLAIIGLTIATLVFRAQVNRSYDRGKPSV
ncbi:hypothetical protein [Paenibacillus sanguinis]|nr:hypothetical protein [Paenibacillus sanguinis]